MEMQALKHEVLDLDKLIAGNSNTVETKYGPIPVTVAGTPGATPLVTFPPVGVTHDGAFRSLIVASSDQSLLLKNFCTYHIDPPGHAEGDTQVPEKCRPLTFGKLGDMVLAVADHFKLTEIVGLGIGAGAAVMATFAKEHPGRMAGMILINPFCKKATYGEWATGRVASLRAAVSVTGMHEGVKTHILKRLLSSKKMGLLGGKSELVDGLRRDLARMPCGPVMEYLRCTIFREDMTYTYKQLRCTTLLVSSYGNMYEADTLHLNEQLDKSQTTFVEMDEGGVLVTEERPAELLGPIQSFLQRLQQMGYGQAWEL